MGEQPISDAERRAGEEYLREHRAWWSYLPILWRSWNDGFAVGYAAAVIYREKRTRVDPARQVSAIENARAALADWREHLTDAPSQARADRMSAALRDLLAHVEATTPTDDEREAMALTLRGEVDGELPWPMVAEVYRGSADRALAAGYRRQEPRPITDEMVEAVGAYMASQGTWGADRVWIVRAALEAAEATHQSTERQENS